MLAYYENDSELFTNLVQALNDYGRMVVNQYKNTLISQDKVSSGKLVDTLDYEVNASPQGTEYLVLLKLQDYWKYVEKGLRGAKNSTSPYPVPSDVGGKPAWKRIYPFILKWVQEKPVAGRALPNGKLPTEKQLSAMISKGIIKNGIVAGNQLADTLRSTNAWALPRLQEALDKDWETYQLKIWADINKLVEQVANT